MVALKAPAQSAGVFFFLEEASRIIRRDRDFNILPVFTAEQLCRLYAWDMNQALRFVLAASKLL